MYTVKRSRRRATSARRNTGRKAAKLRRRSLDDRTTEVTTQIPKSRLFDFDAAPRGKQRHRELCHSKAGDLGFLRIVDSPKSALPMTRYGAIEFATIWKSEKFLGVSTRQKINKPLVCSYPEMLEFDQIVAYSIAPCLVIGRADLGDSTICKKPRSPAFEWWSSRCRR